MWDKLYDFAYDATIGLAKLYQQKTMELVKLTASAAYVQALKVLRKHILLLFIGVFAVAVLAVAVVVLPVSLVMVSEWNASTKIYTLLGLLLTYILVIALCLQNIFSQKKWMKASGIQDLLNSLDPSSK